MKLEQNEKPLLFSETAIPDIFFSEHLAQMPGDYLKIYLYMIFLSKYGKDIKLTPTEYNILKFLTQNKGKVFSIEQIYQSVWDGECYAAENVIAVHIRHIREKIEINPKEPRYLKVIWGVGYKVENVTTGTELMVNKEVILK